VNRTWETFQKFLIFFSGPGLWKQVEGERISARKALKSVRKKVSTASAKKAINSVLNKD
jgi:hypothetical protein